MHSHNYSFFSWQSVLFFAHSIPLKWKLIEVGNSTEYLPCGMKYRLLLLLLSENTRMYQVPREGWICIKKFIFCLKTKQNKTHTQLSGHFLKGWNFNPHSHQCVPCEWNNLTNCIHISITGFMVQFVWVDMIALGHYWTRICLKKDGNVCPSR